MDDNNKTFGPEEGSNSVIGTVCVHRDVVTYVVCRSVLNQVLFTIGIPPP